MSPSDYRAAEEFVLFFQKVWNRLIVDLDDPSDSRFRPDLYGFRKVVQQNDWLNELTRLTASAQVVDPSPIMSRVEWRTLILATRDAMRSLMSFNGGSPVDVQAAYQDLLGRLKTLSDYLPDLHQLSRPAELLDQLRAQAEANRRLEERKQEEDDRRGRILKAFDAPRYYKKDEGTFVLQDWLGLWFRVGEVLRAEGFEDWLDEVSPANPIESVALEMVKGKMTLAAAVEWVQGFEEVCRGGNLWSEATQFNEFVRRGLRERFLKRSDPNTAKPSHTGARLPVLVQAEPLPPVQLKKTRGRKRLSESPKKKDRLTANLYVNIQTIMDRWCISRAATARQLLTSTDPLARQIVALAKEIGREVNENLIKAADKGRKKAGTK